MNVTSFNITLCDEGSARNHFTVVASLADGKLTVTGRDSGLAPLRKWYASRYMYRYFFDEGNTAKLMDVLSAGGNDPAEELKKRCTGTAACRTLREICMENRIRYGFDHQPISRDDDKVYLAGTGGPVPVYMDRGGISEEESLKEEIENPSGPATFFNLWHYIDVSREYDAHDILVREPDGPYWGLFGKYFLAAYFKDRGITDEETEWFDRWVGHDLCSHIAPDIDGMKRARDYADRIIAYRNKTQDSLFDDELPPPWWTRYDKGFYPIRLLREVRIPESLPVCDGIFLCRYHGKDYYYGIAKEETPITEDMRTNGEWEMYYWTGR